MTPASRSGPRTWVTELHRGLLDHRSVLLTLGVIFPFMATAAMGALFSRVESSEALLRIGWAALIAIACAMTAAFVLQFLPRFLPCLSPAQVTLTAFVMSNSVWVFGMVETVTSFGGNPAALPPVFVQLLAITASGVVWQLLITWQVHQQILTHRAMLTEQARLKELEQLVAGERELLDTYRRDLLSVVQRALADDLAKVESGVQRVLEGSTVDDTQTQEAQRLARTAREVSRTIANQSVDFTPTEEARRTAASPDHVVRSWVMGVAGAPISVIWMVIAVVLLRIPVETPQPPLQFAVALLAPVVAVVVVVAVSNTLLGRVSPRARVVIGIARFIVIGVSAWWAIQTWVAPLSVAPGAVSWVGEPAGILPALWILLAAVAIATVLFARGEYERATLSAQASASSIEQARLAIQLKLDQAKDRLADVVHGRVQGSAHALTGALAIYRSQPASPDAAATLATSARSLRTALDDVAATLDPDIPALVDRLDQIPREWEGVMDVEISVDSETRSLLDEDPALASLVVTTCINLSVNAFRHGSARRLELTLTPDSEHMVIEAKDDGLGIAAPESLAFGSGFTRILKSGGRLEFGKAAEFCLIRVLLPLARTSLHRPDVRLSRV